MPWNSSGDDDEQLNVGDCCSSDKNWEISVNRNLMLLGLSGMLWKERIHA